MTLREAGFFLLNKLRTLYDEGEASAITDLVMEKLTGSGKTERMLYKHAVNTDAEEEQLIAYAARLLKHEPVQYVLEEAWFCGFKFQVNPHVLIPRPETEELVEWIISNCRFPISSLTILDIGTGSGCIPVSLKRRIRKADVHTCDLSGEAIATARQNAASLGTEVNFHQLDFLSPEEWEKLPSPDILVSNPPYIPESGKQTMHPNVLQFEPHMALFVPDNDPLVFYKAIASFGLKKLQPEGMIFLEIHEDLGQDVINLLQQDGYSCELKKDMQGKDRMIKAIKKS